MLFDVPLSLDPRPPTLAAVQNRQRLFQLFRALVVVAFVVERFFAFIVRAHGGRAGRTARP